eukprot:TRINITY_DN965_c0_g1_i2.p3 TRINITY_DN965_c0_g1~~TRINITY_DN965_c0_g1_i2.p3  ORF type:complete len:176 (-),score=73.93 TRINITY_DN965_c0_g1_i2:103-630(-)
MSLLARSLTRASLASSLQSSSFSTSASPKAGGRPYTKHAVFQRDLPLKKHLEKVRLLSIDRALEQTRVDKETADARAAEYLRIKNERKAKRARENAINISYQFELRRKQKEERDAMKAKRISLCELKAAVTSMARREFLELLNEDVNKWEKSPDELINACFKIAPNAPPPYNGKN